MQNIAEYMRCLRTTGTRNTSCADVGAFAPKNTIFFEKPIHEHTSKGDSGKEAPAGLHSELNFKGGMR